MTTVLDIITGALQNLGAIAIEEVPSNAEAQSVLQSLNYMLDTWATESLMVYNIAPNVFPLIPGKSPYTLGAGGDFNIPRPVKIDLCYARDSQGNDYAMEVTDEPDYYASIVSKYTQSSIPTLIYDDGNYPLKNIYVWPVPSDGSFSLVLWSWGLIASFTSLNQTVVLPPGYALAMESNLALIIAPKWGRKVDETLAAIAVSSKAQVKRINYSIKEMSFDSALTGKAEVFNWYTGDIGIN